MYFNFINDYSLKFNVIVFNKIIEVVWLYVNFIIEKGM